VRERPPADASPSGAQWVVRHGDEQLVVVEVGGGIRRYTAGGVEILAGYGGDEVATSGRGQQLMPWPNRLRDGKYTFAGAEHQLALTEPTRHNATHGLVRWALWSLLEHTADSVAVGYRLHPQQGWDWRLDLVTRYRLSDDGLTVTATARNVGRERAPFGYGAHPYLSIGQTPVAQVLLTVPAERFLEVDPERQLPVAVHPVEGSDVDFRSARPVGPGALDTAFTGLSRDGAGRWAVTLDGLDTGPVTLWGDETYRWAQVFTGRAHPDTEGSTGIAVEPMTCPPDALNSTDDLLVLEPGQEMAGTWGISHGGTRR